MLSIQHLAFFIENQTAAFVILGVILTSALLLGARALVGLLTRKRPVFKHAQPALTLPVLGNILDPTLFHSERVYDWITEQCVAFGSQPWLLSIPGSVPSIFISTPEFYEDVLQTQFDRFRKEEDGTEYFTDLFGKSMLTSDRDAWVFHRKTASNLFSQRMLRDVMYAAVREIETFCDVLKVYESRDQGTELQDRAVSFHRRRGVNGGKGNEFVDAFAASTAVIFLRFTQPVWRWRLKRYLKIGAEGKNTEYINVIDKFIYRLIDESIERKNTSDASELGATAPPSTDLISLFLTSPVVRNAENLKRKAADDLETQQLIRDTVVNFVFVGKDTTANSMSFFLVMVNRHPAILAKLQEELWKKLPRSPSSGEFLIPSMDDLPQLTNLEAAIRENLRLNPIVPITPRQAEEDVVLSDGTPVPKGARTVLELYATGRSTSVWGDDALKFKPERWIDPVTDKLAAVSPFKFISFFVGPHQCMGMKFAMMEIECTSAVLLSTFDFSTAEDPWEVTYEPAMDLTVKGPLMAKVSSLVD